MAYYNNKPAFRIAHLNVTAAKVMNLLIEMALNNEEREDYIKIDNTNGSYIPVSVEVLGTSEAHGYHITHVSVAHYGEMNGDLMAAPEMEFVAITQKGEDHAYIYPISYRNDYAYGYERVAINLGEDLLPYSFYAGRVRENVEFANMWMRNINEQQGLQVA